MSNANFQPSSREITTVLPVDTTEMTIRKMDWKRIYRKIRVVPRPSSFYSTLSGVAWGVGLSALLSLIPLYQSAQNVEAWVKPVYVIAGIAGVAIGWLSHKFSKERGETVSSSCEEIQLDMAEIHKTFFPEEDL